MPSTADQVREQNSSIEEIFRVLRFCDPAFETHRVLTFSPAAMPPAPAWDLWVENVFCPHIAPALLDCQEHAAADHAHDVIDRDLRLNREIAGPLRNASNLEGRKLLLGFTVPSGARVLARLRKKLDAGSYSPNYATVLAVRCAIFGIAPSQAVAAYLYKEWHCGNPGRLPAVSSPGMEGIFEKISHARNRHQEIPRLRVVTN